MQVIISKGLFFVFAHEKQQKSILEHHVLAWFWGRFKLRSMVKADDSLILLVGEVQTIYFPSVGKLGTYAANPSICLIAAFAKAHVDRILASLKPEIEELVTKIVCRLPIFRGIYRQIKHYH